MRYSRRMWRDNASRLRPSLSRKRSFNRQSNQSLCGPSGKVWLGKNGTSTSGSSYPSRQSCGQRRQCRLRETDASMLVGLRTGLFLCAVPLAVFVGLGVAAGERSRRTLPFLQALPVPMWQVAIAKLLFGWTALIIPALLTVGLILLWVGPDLAATIGRSSLPTEMDPFALGTGNWFLDTALVLPLVATSFCVWTISAGVNRKDEVSAGAVALAVMVAWCAFWQLFGISSFTGMVFRA